MWFIHSSAVCPCLADRSCALSLWMGVNWESQEVLLISIYYSGIWYINYDILYTLALSLSLMDHEIVLSMGISITTSGFLNWDPGSSQLYTCFFFFCLASGRKTTGRTFLAFAGWRVGRVSRRRTASWSAEAPPRASSFFVVIFTTAGSQQTSYR